jgi:hypothetical protein
LLWMLFLWGYFMTTLKWNWYFATIMSRFLRSKTHKIQINWNLYLAKCGQSPDPLAISRYAQQIRTQYRTDTVHTRMYEKQLLKNLLSVKQKFVKTAWIMYVCTSIKVNKNVCLGFKYLITTVTQVLQPPQYAYITKVTATCHCYNTGSSIRTFMPLSNLHYVKP